MNNPIQPHSSRNQPVLFYSGLIAAASALVYFAMTVWNGLTLFDFGDETEIFVAAQMMNQGQRLYQDIFAHHGPLLFSFAQLYTHLASPNDFSYIRLIQGLLALLSCAALWYTPTLKTTTARAWAVAIYLSLLASVWILQELQMVMYASVMGLSFAVPVFQLYVPLFMGVQPRRSGVFASGIVFAAACFAAYTFGPACVLFVAASGLLLIGHRRTPFRDVALPLLGGALLTTAAMLIWLIRYADLEGYLIYHFYFNQVIYAHFLKYTPGIVLGLLNVSFASRDITHTFTLALALLWLAFFIAQAIVKSSLRQTLINLASLALLAAGVLFVNPRGRTGFANAGFVAVNFALFAVACGLVIENYVAKWRRVGPAGMLVALLSITLALTLVVRNATTYPYTIPQRDFKDHYVALKPETGGIYDLVRSVTKREGDFLSLVFHIEPYLRAGRLPASGNLYYFPWQAMYNKQPVDGYKVDICEDMRSHNPAIILFEPWTIWDTYLVFDYEPCIPEIVYAGYLPLKDAGPWFIRKDLLVDGMGIPEIDLTKVPPSPDFAVTETIPLSMAPIHQNQGLGLKQLGVMFRNVGVEDPGKAELRLYGPDGAQFVQQFVLPAISEAKYQFFNVDTGVYTSGEITSTSGDAIGTWEHHDDNGDITTCLVFVYTNGKIGLTPGCPAY